MKKLTASVLEFVTANSITDTAAEVAQLHAAKTIKNVTPVAINSRLAAIDELVGLGLMELTTDGKVRLVPAEETEEEVDAKHAEAIAHDAQEEAVVAAKPEVHKATKEVLTRKKTRLASLKARLAAATERRVARDQTTPNQTELTLTRKIEGVEKFIATHS